MPKKRQSISTKKKRMVRLKKRTRAHTQGPARELLSEIGKVGRTLRRRVKRAL
jgi:hypothetical protein